MIETRSELIDRLGQEYQALYEKYPEGDNNAWRPLALGIALAALAEEEYKTDWRDLVSESRRRRTPHAPKRSNIARGTVAIRAESLPTPSQPARDAAREIHALCDELAPDISSDSTSYAPTVAQITAIISRHLRAAAETVGERAREVVDKWYGSTETYRAYSLCEEELEDLAERLAVHAQRRYQSGAADAAKIVERFFSAHDKRLITAVKLADAIRVRLLKGNTDVANEANAE